MSPISYTERHEQHGRVHCHQQEVNAAEQSIDTSKASQGYLLALRGGGNDSPCPPEPEPLQHQTNMLPYQQRQLYYEAAMAAEPDPSAGYDMNMNTQQQVAGLGGIGDPQQGGQGLYPNQNNYNPSSHQSHEVAMQQQQQQSLQFQQQQQQQFHSQQQLFLRQQSMQTQTHQAQSAHQQYYPQDMYPGLMNGGNGSSQHGSLNDYAVALRHQQEVAMIQQQEVALRQQQYIAMRQQQELNPSPPNSLQFQANQGQADSFQTNSSQHAMRQQELNPSPPNTLQIQANQGQADLLQSQVIQVQTKHPSYPPMAPFQRQDTLSLLNNLSVQDDPSNQQRLLDMYGVAAAAANNNNSSPFELPQQRQISNHTNQIDMKRPSTRDPNQVDMKSWIAVALKSLERKTSESSDVSSDTTQGGETTKNTTTLSSGAYLQSALKIAYSLADQLCMLEEEDEGKQEDGGKGADQAEAQNAEGGSKRSASQIVPAQGLRWPDLVTIILNDKVEDKDGSTKNKDPSKYKNTKKMGEHRTSRDEKKDDSFEPLPIGRFPLPAPAFSPESPGRGGDNTDSLDLGSFHPIEEGQAAPSPTRPAQQGRCGREGFIPRISESGQDLLDDSCRSFPDTDNVGLMDYLNVSSAKLGGGVENTGDAGSGSLSPQENANDKRMQMYYLGLVFFELFSGGKRPISELGEDLLEDHPVQRTSSSDLNAMNIIGDLGDDDELFGGIELDDSDHGELEGQQNRRSSSSELDESNRSDGPRSRYTKKGRSYSKDHLERETQTAQKLRSTIEESCITVEPLKSLGLPVTLCDLIGNMLDCKRTELIGADSYNCMSDVKKDLKLLLDFSEIYLNNLDLGVACRIGIQMDDRIARWYGRDTEFKSLQKAYHRSISHQCDVAIICGQTGLGKTSLAEEFTRYAQMGDKENNIKACVFLGGKFDKLHQSQPLSPIASVFNKYCEWLLSSKDSATIVGKVSNALKQALGQETYALARAIPSLSKIMGKHFDMDDDASDDGFEDAQKRLRYLFCQFTEAISHAHDAPLVLFLDNLQWADQASMDLIKQLVLVSEPNTHASSKKIFFFGCCNETPKDHPLWKMLESVSDFDVKTTKIKLECLEKEVVNSMISKKLNMLPRLTRPLTDIIHHKSRGNPFFVKQILIELSKEGLLRPSLSRQRWVWDKEKIEERELPEDVVEFLTASLNRLPSKVLSALCTLSCFGSSSDRSLVQLENELELNLSEALDHAVKEGLLNKKNENYYFVDDRVQEATYSLMKPDERCLHHFNYGLALCPAAERNNDDGLFLIAVGQINLGGPKAASVGEENLTVAKYNLKAGKRAMAMSDFCSAYWFFDYGISFLQKGHWEKHYDLTLKLFDGAAECALVIGERDSLSILSEQVLHRAKCVNDKLNIFYITVRLLMYRSNLPAAIECGINALSTLGEDFPEEITPDTVLHFVEDTKEMLEAMADEDILNHEIMTDQRQIMTMKFLGKLMEPLFMIRPSDQPVVVLKMVQFTLEHGLSPISPLAFVAYGSFLASMGGIREGCRYARIAKKLLSKASFRQFAGEVIAYSTQLIAYAEPVQSAIEFHLEGYKLAMASGATPYAMLNALLYDSCSYWSGKKLHLVKRQLDQTLSLIKQHKHMLMLVQLMPLYGTVSKMIGLAGNHRPANSDLEFDSQYDTEEAEWVLRKKNPFQSKPHYFNKMYTAFVYRNYDGMKSAAEQYSNFKIGSWVFVFSSSVQIFYEGLVSFWIGRQEKDEAWISRGRKCCRAIESMSDSCSSWNFENKARLLRAEENYADGNLDLAETLYDSAIFSAKEHRFINEEALANQLSGFFYLETGSTNNAKICFSHAIEKYREWEAFGPATSLDQRLNFLMNNATR